MAKFALPIIGCISLLAAGSTPQTPTASIDGSSIIADAEHPDAALNTPQGKTALAFACALADGKFEEAYEMLTPKLRREYSAERLNTDNERMIAYAGKTAATETVVTCAMMNWPGKEPADIGWAYVSISGPDEKGSSWGEAV